MTGPAIPTQHGTCVAIGEIGILLRGPSGAGKSDLAFRLIEAGATLVADDRVDLSVRSDRLVANAPPELAGRLELRGIGIVELPTLTDIVVELIADLAPSAAIDRLPARAWEDIGGIPIRRIDVSPFEQSAVAKIRIAAYDAVSQPDPVTGAHSDGEDSAKS